MALILTHKVAEFSSQIQMGRADHHSRSPVSSSATVVRIMQTLVIIGVAFLAMEPITYATHRWIMHGVGIRLHRSHHRVVPKGRWEANDWFPVIFASVVMLGFAAGFNIAGWTATIPIGIGVTAYGLAYAVVHDGYTHRRIPLIGRRKSPALERLAEAHRMHHRFNGEPYGMLFPILPAALRERAAQTAQRASGSDPSQVPVE
jgi:beta-carotene 3-hydroxylase